MKWVRVAVNIGSDPSVGGIADALRLQRPTAVGLCVLVFAQLPEHARTGDLSDVSDSTLESWAAWRGKRGAFAKAFREYLCGPDGVVKAWDKHNGAAIREADATRERVRNLRKKPNGTEDVRRTVGVTGGSDGTGRDVTGRTTSGKDLTRGEPDPHPDVEKPRSAPLVADATRNDNRQGNDDGERRLEVSRSAVVKDFLTRFYADASDDRRVDVMDQLRDAVTASGAKLEGKTHVRAVDLEHLEDSCTAVIHSPPRAPGVAIRFVLLRLQSTFTETHSARNKRAEPPRQRSAPTPIGDVVAKAVA